MFGTINSKSYRQPAFRDYRSAGLGALLNDLGLEGLGIGTACWLHEIPAAKARTGAHLNLSAHHALALRGWVGDVAGRLR